MDVQNFSVFAALATAFAAVAVAPIVQIYVGRKQAAAAQRSADAALINAQNAGKHAISRFRQEWINSLRKDIAEFHSLLMTTAEHPYPKDVDLKLSETGTRIQLYLNPNEPESSKLLKLMNEMYDCSSLEDRMKMDIDFIASAQAILKKEWDRVKLEMM